MSPDVNHLNRLIKKAEDQGLHFLGEWHRHPGDFSRPSQGDVSTINQIMNGNNLKEYIAIIASGSGEVVRMNPYVFSTFVRYDQPKWALLSGNEGKVAHVERKEACNQQVSEPESSIEQETPKATVEKPKYAWYERLRRMFFQQPDNESVDQSDHPWFESEAGKGRLLLEKRLMSQLFPDFSLFRKNNAIFWSGVYKGYRIILKYPDEYPAKFIQISLKPNLDKLKDEKNCFYATLAAQIAYIRIENAVPTPRPVEYIYEGTEAH